MTRVPPDLFDRCRCTLAWPVLAVGLLWAGFAEGQAPIITADGDPSLSAESIYGLAVDPWDHPEEDAVLLLDDGVVVLEADGTGRRTYRMVTQVLTRDAVSTWAEHNFTYDADREDFVLNWARVVGADGRVISEEPVHQQVLDAPVAQQSPIYTNRKRVRISLSGVEPGTIVDYSYTRTTLEPSRPDDFYASWLMSTGRTVKHSRYIVEAPADYDLGIFRTEGTPHPVVTDHGDRRVYTWAVDDIERIEPESFAAARESELYQRVAIGPSGSWQDVGSWYAGLARDRYSLSDEITAAARGVAGDADGEGALRALYRWVAQDFRYVSISLGLGGYQPRSPQEVFQSRAGDCKDKATLFIALAREYGFDAYPVLLHSTSPVDRDLPSILQFNHAIAAVRIGDEWVYLDLTESIIPFGEVSPAYQGEFGLIAFDDGRVEEVTFPASGPEDNVSAVSIEGELFEDGRFEGSYVERHAGASQYALRSVFAQEYTPREAEQFADQLAGAVIPGGRGSDLEMFHGLDLEAEPVVSVTIHAARATQPNVGGGRIFPLPLDSYANPALITLLEREVPRRRFPIDVDQVSGPFSTFEELELHLPEGWLAQLPSDVLAESRFGTYEARYHQEGRTLTVSRRFVGAVGVAPPEAMAELIEWLERMAEDDVRFVLLGPADEVEAVED